MKKKRNLYPVFVVIVFFFFTLLHQTDKLLIGSLQIPVSKTFQSQRSPVGIDQYRRPDRRDAVLPDLGLPV